MPTRITTAMLPIRLLPIIPMPSPIYPAYTCLSEISAAPIALLPTDACVDRSMDTKYLCLWLLSLLLLLLKPWL